MTRPTTDGSGRAFDVLMGGGRRFFVPTTVLDEEGTAGARTPQTHTIGGINFVRYTARSGGAVSPELWWNAEQLFPSSFVTADAQDPLGFRSNTFASALMPRCFDHQPLASPEYRVVDVAEWLEQH